MFNLVNVGCQSFNPNALFCCVQVENFDFQEKLLWYYVTSVDILSRLHSCAAVGWKIFCTNELIKKLCNTTYQTLGFLGVVIWLLLSTTDNSVKYKVTQKHAMQQHTKEKHTHINSFITCNFVILNFTKEQFYLSHSPSPVQFNINEMVAQTVLQSGALSKI
jgi:hypothetical protein